MHRAQIETAEADGKMRNRKQDHRKRESHRDTEAAGRGPCVDSECEKSRCLMERWRQRWGVKRAPNTRGGALGRPRARPWKGKEKGQMTTGLYGPREMPFKNSGDYLGVSFPGGRGTWALDVIIGPCLGSSRGVFGAQMVNSMRAGILSVL